MLANNIIFNLSVLKIDDDIIPVSNLKLIDIEIKVCSK